MIPPTPNNEPFEVEIRLKGHIDPRRSGWFEGMTLINEINGTLILRGQVTDQAALFALISRIRDLNLKLIAIQRI